MTRLEKQMAFIEEVDKIKLIGRQNYLADGSRKENDAEHSWHLALMTMLLSEYANEEIDVLKTMSMVLIHDLVEIDAGDTYAYDYEAQKNKREREEAAAERIFNILPEDQAKKMRDLWEEFEAEETPEARFAAAVDRVQPAMLNSASGGISWKEHGVTMSHVLRRNGKAALGSQVLWDYEKEHFIMANVEKGLLENDMEDNG